MGIDTREIIIRAQTYVCDVCKNFCEYLDALRKYRFTNTDLIDKNLKGVLN